MSSIYSYNPTDILDPNALRAGAVSQFQGFLAACGEAAAAVVAAVQGGTQSSGANVNYLVQYLHSKGLASNQGTTSLRGLATGLGAEGIQSTVVDNWQQAIAQWTGRRPVALLFQNAQALPTAPSGLRGHFATVVGFSPSTSKFIVADAETGAARAGNFNLYSFADLVRSRPVGALIPSSDPVGGGGVPLNPSGKTGQQLVQGAVANNAVGQFTADAISGGITKASRNLLDAFGLNSARDLGYRIVLIGAGLIILFIALIAIVQPEQKVEEAAPYAAMAAG